VPLVPLILAATVLLAGCATTYGQGAKAYREGRYDEAAARFQAVLAEDPNRLEALIGLGRAQYKLGAWNEAIDVLERAAAAAPRHAGTRLFLGLAYLQRGDEGRADEHLTVYRDLRPDPRTASLVDRALSLLRGAPLTPELRTFVAASLEDSAEWQRELNETRLALQEEEYRRWMYYDRVFYLGPWIRCR